MPSLKALGLLELGCVEYHEGMMIPGMTLGQTVYAADKYEWSDKEQKKVMTKKYMCWEKGMK
jgi:hypothetical protein